MISNAVPVSSGGRSAAYGEKTCLISSEILSKFRGLVLEDLTAEEKESVPAG